MSEIQIKTIIFSIGEELLEGSIADTNSSVIARLLSEFGNPPQKIITLPDKIEPISDALCAAVKDYGLIIATGGLGPTFDDVTIQAVAKAFSLKLEQSSAALQHISKRLAARGLEMTAAQADQALYPQGGEVIINPVGTAPALRLEVGGSLLFFLPGVPAEMAFLTENIIAPYIKERFSLVKIFKVDLFFRRMPESYGDQAIKKIGIPEGVKCIINVLPNRSGVIRIRSASQKDAESFVHALISELGEYYAGEGALRSSAQELAEILFNKNITFATAESCTGGLAASKLTEIAGISEVFKGGAVTYSNSVKSSLLGVSEEILERSGAVSEETAIQMVLGVKKLLKTDAAVSITGYAGGNAFDEGEETGKVFIAAAFGERTVCGESRFMGNRNEVREQAAESALELARRLINGEI